MPGSDDTGNRPDPDEGGSRADRDGGRDRSEPGDPVLSGDRGAASLWRRWDRRPSADPKLHLHRYCSIPPLDPVREPDATVDGGDPPPLRILPRGARLVLRNTPLVVALSMVVSLVVAEVVPGPVGGPAEFFGVGSVSPSGGVVTGVAVLVLWLGAVVVLLGRSDVVTAGEVYRGAVWYGLAAILATGTALSVATVTLAPDPTALGRNVVYGAGLHLSFLVAGTVAYDGVLRAEHLFWNLDRARIMRDEEQYHRFREDLASALGATVGVDRGDWSVAIPSAYVFGVLFVVPFVGVNFLQQMTVDRVLLFSATGVLMFIVAVVFYQFLVLVKQFYRLIADRYRPDDDARLRLRYEPFHPDRHGGFRDVGRFVTRVNVLLLIGGLQAVHRLYVAGTQELVLLEGGLLAAGGVKWAGNFVAPVAVYGFAVLVWAYYSFWQLHLKMVTERKRLIDELQRRAREKPDDRPGEGAGTDPPSSNGRRHLSTDAPPWRELNDAPVWPIRVRGILGILSAHAASALLSVPKFLGGLLP